MYRLNKKQQIPSYVSSFHGHCIGTPVGPVDWWVSLLKQYHRACQSYCAKGCYMLLYWLSRWRVRIWRNHGAHVACAYSCVARGGASQVCDKKSYQVQEHVFIPIDHNNGVDNFGIMNQRYEFRKLFVMYSSDSKRKVMNMICLHTHAMHNLSDIKQTINHLGTIMAPPLNINCSREWGGCRTCMSKLPITPIQPLWRALYSLGGKISYRKISRSPGAAR